MTKEEIKKWEGTPAKAVYVVSADCCMEILGYEHETYAYYDKVFAQKYVIIKGFAGYIHRYKLRRARKGVYFTYHNGCRYYLKDFLAL